MTRFYNSRIGFMQGRLSELVDGRIQAFPWDSWQNEIFLAKEIGIQLMEWTVDSEKIESNPILLSDEHTSITKLSNANNISITSVTDDFFMENPPPPFRCILIIMPNKNTTSNIMLKYLDYNLAFSKI